MTLYARLREGEGTWADRSLQNLEGTPLGFTPEKEWVKVICFDDVTGLYVLTEDEDNYFTCESILLEFEDEQKIPVENWVSYVPNFQEQTYTITTPDGVTDFFYAETMWQAFEDAKNQYGEGVTIRPSWYGEWDCGVEGSGACYYDKYGNHHKSTREVTANG